MQSRVDEVNIVTQHGAMETLRDIGTGLISLTLFAIIAVGTYRYLDAKGVMNVTPPKATKVSVEGAVEVKTARPLAVITNDSASASTANVAPKAKSKSWALVGKGANGDDAVAGPFVLTNCTGKVDVTKTAPGKDAEVGKGMLKKDWQVSGELFLPRGTYALLKGNICSGFRPE
ncbi:MAG: hypothetical protein GY822_32880 [Deltaproteobacteria bacterium]|nr:hypothetical protein [Deltaproteobacteria bacterium]